MPDSYVVAMLEKNMDDELSAEEESIMVEMSGALIACSDHLDVEP